jgi:hypothetical protein
MTRTRLLHLLKYQWMDQVRLNYKFDKAKTSSWSVNVINKIPGKIFTELYLKKKKHIFAWDVIYSPTQTEIEEVQTD